MLDFIIKYWVQILFSLLYGTLVLWFKKIWKGIKDLTQMKKILRIIAKREIESRYSRYMGEKYCPLCARDDFAELYSSYESLGWNSISKDLNEKIMDLPTEKPGGPSCKLT